MVFWSKREGIPLMTQRRVAREARRFTPEIVMDA